VDDLLSEKEQIEKMRAWWSDYGTFVVGGIALGALVLFGMNYYQDSQREAAYRASGLYDALTDFVVDGDVDDAEALMGQLDSDFGDTNYAAQAKLAMARMYMDQNRDEDAAASLDALLAMDVDEEFKHVARLRLAKIYLYQDRPEEAAALVEGRDAGAFAERYAEVQGDAYVALGRIEAARDAYQRALIESAAGPTVDQNFVQLKLLDLPDTATFAGDDFGDEAEAGEGEDAAPGADDAPADESGEAAE
jgi:predicted negative regulator of RcsB-dependent stress response